MIEGWKFLKSWERAGVPLLTAAGYAVKSDNALRTRGKAIELVSLQRDAKKERFTINLAIGHEFARSFRDGKTVQMANGYEEAVFLARLGILMDGKDTWWPYGKTEAEAEKTISAITGVAVAYADAWFATLADPGAAYLALKKGDLGRENLWHLAIYARALGQIPESNEWLERIAPAPTHVTALKKEWAKA